MSGGIGATNKDGEWHIVSSNGKQIVDEAYDDVIIDDKSICFRNSRVFVKKAGKCYMLDETGNKIKTEVQLEDAYPFLEENGLAAVKVNGKWGFMDKDGKMIIKPTYKNAKSFKNGYAAVSKAGRWGFIDSDNKLVFDYIFQEVKDFTSAGTVFVKEYGEWKLMVLYKFNHN